MKKVTEKPLLQMTPSYDATSVWKVAYPFIKRLLSLTRCGRFRECLSFSSGISGYRASEMRSACAMQRLSARARGVTGAGDSSHCGYRQFTKYVTRVSVSIFGQACDIPGARVKAGSCNRWRPYGEHAGMPARDRLPPVQPCVRPTVTAGPCHPLLGLHPARLLALLSDLWC